TDASLAILDGLVDFLTELDESLCVARMFECEEFVFETLRVGRKFGDLENQQFLSLSVTGRLKRAADPDVIERFQFGGVPALGFVFEIQDAIDTRETQAG